MPYTHPNATKQYPTLAEQTAAKIAERKALTPPPGTNNFNDRVRGANYRQADPFNKIPGHSYAGSEGIKKEAADRSLIDTDRMNSGATQSYKKILNEPMNVVKYGQNAVDQARADSIRIAGNTEVAGDAYNNTQGRYTQPNLAPDKDVR